MRYFLPRPSARMTTSLMRGCSDQIGKGALGATKIPDTEPEEEGDNAEANKKSRQVEGTFAAEDAPPKAVDHADDRIEAIPKAPFLWHDRAGKANRRNIKTKL